MCLFYNRDAFKDNAKTFHIKGDAKLLSSIGFNEDVSQIALDVAGNDVNKAIFLLIYYTSSNGPIKEENVMTEDEKENAETFKANLTMEEAQNLRCGDIIDHRLRPGGRFHLSVISEKDGSNLKIHPLFAGNDIKYDDWMDYTQQLKCFSKPGSITNRPAHRLKHLQNGDVVDINPLQQQSGWTCGVIEVISKESGQLQIKYYFNNEDCYYWTHRDNVLEVKSSTYQFE
eukprot:93590_1